MHELSIAASIIELVDQEARKAEAKTVSKVELDVGKLSGVEIEALEFAWEMVIKNTVAENAELVINHLDARSKCEDCGETFITVGFFSPCPGCGGFHHLTFQGKELQVKAITID